MSTVTHVAGPFLNFNSKFIQRCMVCGEVLCSGDLLNMAFVSTRPDDTGQPARWAVGSLVQCDAGDSDPVRRSVLVGELSEEFNTDTLPADFCLSLVEM